MPNVALVTPNPLPTFRVSPAPILLALPLAAIRLMLIVPWCRVTAPVKVCGFASVVVELVNNVSPPIPLITGAEIVSPPVDNFWIPKAPTAMEVPVSVTDGPAAKIIPRMALVPTEGVPLTAPDIPNRAMWSKVLLLGAFLLTQLVALAQTVVAAPEL